MFMVEIGGVERRIEDIASLQEWIDNKLIVPTTPVWVEAEGRLIEAQEIPGLSFSIKSVASSPDASVDDSYRYPRRIPDYLILSIVSMMFCCLPVGVVAVVYAAQVNSHLRRGDLYEAEIASRTARTWALWSIGIGLLVIAIYAANVSNIRH
jgi:hypothetical protein